MPGDRIRENPAGASRKCGLEPSILLWTSRPEGMDAHGGHHRPVCTAQATAGSGPGAQPSAQGGWRRCSRWPRPQPGGAWLFAGTQRESRTRGTDSGSREAQVATRPDGGDAVTVWRDRRHGKPCQGLVEGTAGTGGPCGDTRCPTRTGVGRRDGAWGLCEVASRAPPISVDGKGQGQTREPRQRPGVPGFGDVHVCSFVLLVSTVGVVTSRMVRTCPCPNPGL